MRIKSQPDNKGYTIWLSARDTYDWAHKVGAAWPCSTLADNRIVACVDSNGLYDLTVNGKSPNDHTDIDGSELDACIGDHLPKHLRHLWPTWEHK